MAHGEATTVIARPPAEIIDFVLDLRRYREVDDKLGTIHSVVPAADGRGVLVRFRPRLMGLPGPTTTQRVVPDGDRIDISGVPAWTDAIATFAASFTCEPTPEGTRVTRVLDFRFRRPFARLLDPVLERWLARAVPDELARAKAYLESGRDRRGAP